MKQEIADIRSEFDQENNKIPVKVESSLKKIEKSYESLNKKVDDADNELLKQKDDYGKLYKESKTRQSKIQELERDIDTLNEDKDKILKDTKHEDYDELIKYKSDNETLLAEGKKVTRKQFIERYKDLKEHSDYDKCKSGFTLPETEDDWDSIDDDAMVANTNKLKEQEGYGFFGGGKGGHDEKKAGKGGDDKKVYYPKGTFKSQ